MMNLMNLIGIFGNESRLEMSGISPNMETNMFFPAAGIVFFRDVFTSFNDK
jgi:hypothetical protein